MTEYLGTGKSSLRSELMSAESALPAPDDFRKQQAPKFSCTPGFLLTYEREESVMFLVYIHVGLNE